MLRRSPPRRSAAWQAWYQNYLASPEWDIVRRKVIARARGLCEGCAGPGEEVHHVSYDHVGEEFMFELLYLCRDCHERWHGRGRYADKTPFVPPGSVPADISPFAPVSEEERLERELAASVAGKCIQAIVDDGAPLSFKEELEKAKAADVAARVRLGLLPSVGEAKG
jgi:hypothetical protein